MIATDSGADNPGGASPAGVQSIRRVVSLLRVLATGQASGLSLQAIAQAAGVPRPTVHRMLKALIAEGIVEQHARSRRYAIGEQIPMLALARPQRSALLEAAEPVVARAAREIGDTVFLTIRTGDDSLCIARSLGSYPVQILLIEVGARRPLGAASAGVAILSRLPPDEVEAVLRRNAARLAAHRVDPERASARVEACRRRAFALSDRGVVPGTRAISVPIAETPVSPLGALTVAAISNRLNTRREREVAERLTELSNDLGRRLRGL